MADEDLQYNGQLLASYRVTDLKDILKQVGKPVGGTKAVLIKRLAEHIRENALDGVDSGMAMISAMTTTVAENLQQTTPEAFVLPDGASMLSNEVERIQRQAAMQIEQSIAQQQQEFLVQHQHDLFTQQQLQQAAALQLQQQHIYQQQTEAIQYTVGAASFDLPATITVDADQPAIVAGDAENEVQQRGEGYDATATEPTERAAEDSPEVKAAIRSVSPTPITKIDVDAAAAQTVGTTEAPTVQRSTDADEVSFAIDQDDLQRYIGVPAMTTTSVASRPSPSGDRGHRGNDDDSKQGVASNAGTVDKTGDAEIARSDVKRKLNDSSEEQKTNRGRTEESDYDNGVKPFVKQEENLAGSEEGDKPSSAVTHGASKRIKLRRADRPMSPIASSINSAARASTPPSSANTIESVNNNNDEKFGLPEKTRDDVVNAASQVGSLANESGEQAMDVSAEPMDHKLVSDDSIATKTVENATAVEPPLENATNVVLIRNLTRPFTIKQLRQLIESHGAIADGEDTLWLDRIKSQCVCQLASVDDAVKVQHALNRVVWPDKSSKQLYVRYESEEMLRDLLDRSKKGEIDITPHMIVQEKSELKRKQQRTDDNRSSRRNSFQQPKEAADTATQSMTKGKKSDVADDDDDDTLMEDAAGEKPSDPSVLVTVSLRDRRHVSGRNGDREEQEVVRTRSDKSGDIKFADAKARTGRTEQQHSPGANQRTVDSRDTGRTTSDKNVSLHMKEISTNNQQNTGDDAERRNSKSSKVRTEEKSAPQQSDRKERPKTLDELFSKTQAKPPIYYMEVDAEVARTRREHRLKSNPPGSTKMQTTGVADGNREISVSGSSKKPVLAKQQSPGSPRGKLSAPGSSRHERQMSLGSGAALSPRIPIGADERQSNVDERDRPESPMEGETDGEAVVDDEVGVSRTVGNLESDASPQHSSDGEHSTDVGESGRRSPSGSPGGGGGDGESDAERSVTPLSGGHDGDEVAADDAEEPEEQPTTTPEEED